MPRLPGVTEPPSAARPTSATGPAAVPTGMPRGGTDAPPAPRNRGARPTAGARADQGGSTAEHPWPVRVVSAKIGGWIARLGAVWVEGQIAQITRRPGAVTVFLVLRDPSADISLSVTCQRSLLDGLSLPLAEGARVVVHARPDFYPGRGSLSLRAFEIRPVGIGELLARIERVKAALATEGLFADERKRRLPFLQSLVGLVTGRASAAEHDVRTNAAARWPAVRFRVCNVAVQGPGAVPQLVGALRNLDSDPAVDVIVLARGGGSVEDLLPFSDEALCRAVAACRTPVLSAVGHEQDSPLVDLVADVRASTPTDAGKRIVPDLGEERHGLQVALGRLRRSVEHLLARENAWLDSVRSRPALALPLAQVETRRADVQALVERSHRCLAHRLDAAAADLAHTRARVTALSPASTLQRGYAVVQRSDGAVVRRPEDVEDGEQVAVRLADGQLTARVTDRTSTDRTSTEPSTDAGGADGAG
jgi:exodeoxyribonuclease VII large subunit